MPFSTCRTSWLIPPSNDADGVGAASERRAAAPRWLVRFHALHVATLHNSAMLGPSHPEHKCTVYGVSALMITIKRGLFRYLFPV